MNPVGKIEAVIVCHNYADFLEVTLPENLQHIDHVVVITHPDDKATLALCNKFGVDVIDTKLMHEDGALFDKARAINLGLSHLKHDGWVLHLDADILLPHRFRNMLAHAKLSPENIYGADRLNVPNYDEWLKNKHKTTPQFAYRYLVTPNEEFPIGSRLLHKEYGYCPIGYFQLWNATAKRRYPIIAGSAEHTDVMFAVQWARENRILLPEFFVYHLESEKSKMGINWDGRKTKYFGPQPPPFKGTSLDAEKMTY
jgi:hypothetical protein